MMNHYIWKIAEAYGRPENVEIISGLDEDEALTGPHGNLDRVIEDDIMGKPFGPQIRELAKSYGLSLREDGALPQAIGCPLLEFINHSNEIAHPILVDAEMDHAKIVLLPDSDTFTSTFAAISLGGDDMWRIRGLILDSDICVSSTYRDLGLGSAMVAAQLLHEGGLKVWDHDKHGFSTSGVACARRGLRLAQDLGQPWLSDTPSP